MREPVLSNEDLLAIATFDKYVKRFVRFAKPLQKPTALKITMSTKPKASQVEVIGIPSELRFSALLNSLRPLLLKTDPFSFSAIRKPVNKYYYLTSGVIDKKQLTSYRKTWSSLTNKDGANPINMPCALSIDGLEITSYAKLLDYFIYGKYVHSDPNKFIVISRIENNPSLYAQAKMSISECIYALSLLLDDFHHDYIAPIMKEYALQIKELYLNVSW